MSSAQLLFVIFASVGLTAIVLAGSILILRRLLPNAGREIDGAAASVVLRPRPSARRAP